MAELGEENARISRVSVDFSRLLGKSYMFLGTLVLAISGWLVSFVSQAFVTANIGNGPVGTLWFAVFLQLGIIISLILSLHTNTLFQHGIPLAILAALTTSLGAQGVDRNLFSNTPAQQALSAGWIITCIVDVIWIVLLSSEPSSFIFRLFATGSGGGGRNVNVGVRTGDANGIGTNLDPLPTKYTTEGSLPDTQRRSAMGGSAVGSGVVDEENRHSRLRSSVADPETHKRRSAGVWGTYTPPHSVGEGTSMRNMASVPPEPSSVVQETTTGVLSDGGTTTSDAGGNTERERTVSGHTAGSPKLLGKAVALFDYNASSSDAYEVSFAKGEALDVVDKTGKWWEVIKPNGMRGIAPSNYLKLLT